MERVDPITYHSLEKDAGEKPLVVVQKYGLRWAIRFNGVTTYQFVLLRALREAESLCQ
jgi:hypothetical protein